MKIVAIKTNNHLMQASMTISNTTVDKGLSREAGSFCDEDEE